MMRESVVIVLAEDDAGHARLIEKNLQRGGIANEVVHAVDGQEALDYLQCTGRFADRNPNGPLLLVLDINMPRIDGVEVLRRIKSDPVMD